MRRYYNKKERLRNSLACHVFVNIYNSKDKYSKNEGIKSFDSVKLSTRMMFDTDESVETEQATSVTKKLSTQEPTSMSIFGFRVKSCTIRNVVLTGITIGGLVLLYRFIDRKLGKKQENKPLQSDLPPINQIEKVWPGEFYKYYPMPEFPPIIQEILTGTPKGHEKR